MPPGAPLRNACTADISTSLNVVSIAIVCRASTKWRATVRRNMVMGTTSSSRVNEDFCVGVTFGTGAFVSAFETGSALGALGADFFSESAFEFSTLAESVLSTLASPEFAASEAGLAGDVSFQPAQICPRRPRLRGARRPRRPPQFLRPDAKFSRAVHFATRANPASLFQNQ